MYKTIIMHPIKKSLDDCNSELKSNRIVKVMLKTMVSVIIKFHPNVSRNVKFLTFTYCRCFSQQSSNTFRLTTIFMVLQLCHKLKQLL